jgi:hypothetical protein
VRLGLGCGVAYLGISRLVLLYSTSICYEALWMGCLHLGDRVTPASGG